jgi:hypothetical protein
MSELADGQPLILRDLTTGDEVTLEGAALPLRNVAAGAKLRHSTTWYPGATAASVQVLGVEEEPITFEGDWRDTLLGLEDGAAALVAAVRSLFLAQHKVEIAWGTLLVRRGMISRFTPTFQGQAVIGWSLEFMPTQTDEPETVVATVFPATPETAVAWWEVVDAILAGLTLGAAIATRHEALF